MPIDPNAVYRLGAAGSLRDLPGIPWGSAVASERAAPAVIHTSLAGRRTRDVLGPVKRSWSFSWRYLFTAQMTEIEGILDGPLPLLLVDPFIPGAPIEVILESYTRSFVSPTEVDVALKLLEV